MSTIFAPRLRYASNMDHPAVRAGYAIMAEVAERIVAMTYTKGIQVVFTIIPTKELVYAQKVVADNLIMPG